MNDKHKLAPLFDYVVQLPSPAAPRIKEKKQSGRRKDEGRHIAVFAHLEMMRPEISGIGGWGARRLQVAELLSVGNPHDLDNRERQIRDHIQKAKTTLKRGEWFRAMWSGDARGDGRVWVMLDAGKRHRVEPKGENILLVDGWGWMCEWGEARARYGHIQSGQLTAEGGEKLPETFLSLTPPT